MLGKPAVLTLILGATGLLATSSAHAERGSYRGPHPIPEENPGSFCHIDASHTHTYTPAAHASGYLLHEEAGNPQHEFAGDPSGLGYEGPLIAYGEQHPMHFKGGSGDVEAECYTEGPHFHLHEPFDLSRFEEYKGTYYFVSYKAAMTTRQNIEKFRRAEAKLLRTEKRALQAQTRRAKKGARQFAGKAGKAASPSTTSRKAVVKPKAPASTPPKKKAKAKGKSTKKAFRGWMDRRRGR